MKSPIINLHNSGSALKWVALSVYLLSALWVVYYTGYLVEQLKQREISQVQLYAKALKYSLREEAHEALFVLDEIINNNFSVPTILTNEADSVLSYRNIDINEKWPIRKKRKAIEKELADMKKNYPPIRVELKLPNAQQIIAVNYVYYKNSTLLSKLILYPILQIILLLVLGTVGYTIFDSLRAAEQDKVWVGLTKETAHQLGTPLSSLMAWAQVLRDMPELKDKEIVEELEKDIVKLVVIAERFSSIGSVPKLSEQNVVYLVVKVVDYLSRRVSQKIQFRVQYASDNITAMLHAPLLEWVIENVCKNAVDAIVQHGIITIKIARGNNRRAYIDITDTGKGMSPATVAKIFNPGFTTKKRGWGLGLTLCKRIIETYYHGKIYVRSSVENQGTTFRIELQAPPPPKKTMPKTL